MNNAIENKCVNTIRFLSVDAIEKAKSGHPGLPMGAAPMAYTVWAKHMKFNCDNPDWANRDRFVLSGGHGSMLLYSLLHLCGFDMTLEDIKNFRQWGSKAAGHPEYGEAEGIEMTTGPLGQGLSTAVGMAIAEQFLAENFNRPGYRLVDHYTYVIAGDGDMMEGITSEASSIAGHLKLGKLICLYDDNEISIEGSTDIAFTEDVAKRYEAYGWQVIKVKDGNDINAIDDAISQAKEEEDKPSLIIVPTIIGYGSPAKQGTADVHGAPLGKDEVINAKRNLGWPEDKEFYIPDDVKEHFEDIKQRGKKLEQQWNDLWQRYQKEYPELADKWNKWFTGEIIQGIENDPSLWDFDGDMATRKSSGIVLNKIADKVTNLIGGSADLAPSNNTNMKDKGDFTPETRTGRNLHFGVREHAMGSIINGITLHGGLRAFGATFLVFADYMRPAIRLAALMKQPAIYVFTHDSIAVGEDGPTHQPIEHLASLRVIPGLTVIRPCDAKETADAWVAAIKNTEGPTALILTRQGLPTIDKLPEDSIKGGYILKDSEKDMPDVILMASGSEVSLVMNASQQLKDKGIDARVVSMPSWEIFDKQSEEYKNKVLPDNVKTRVAVEAGSTMGWHKYVGDQGVVIGIDRFGASAPGDVVMEKFGFTVENVVKNVMDLIK
ncbi:MAG: transketolase [Clostridia bacterium]|nr:transketolase [Clostridia bacterium]